MSDKQWFETWFNTPYYHLLYNNRNECEAEDFVLNLVTCLHPDKATKILDVACGKGRHSRYMAKLGYDTTGIDLAEHSIAEAKKEPLPNLHFEVWDMRKVYKEAYFDLVVNLFSSFGYFDDENDDMAAIQAMADDLKPGGTLVMDYMNAEAIVKSMKPRYLLDRGDIQFHIKKRIENGFIRKDIDFLVDGENHHYEEHLKIIKPEQFAKLFKAAGLEITKIFGDYALKPFVPGDSMRQVIVGRKL